MHQDGGDSRGGQPELANNLHRSQSASTAGGSIDHPSRAFGAETCRSFQAVTVETMNIIAVICDGYPFSAIGSANRSSRPSVLTSVSSKQRLRVSQLGRFYRIALFNMSRTVRSRSCARFAWPSLVVAG